MAKMSSSNPEGTIFLSDHPFAIREKMRTAFCPETIEDNPVLQIARLSIGEAWESGGVRIGDRTFKSYEELERAFLLKEVSPSDLKLALAEVLIKILAPVRIALGEEGLNSI